MYLHVHSVGCPERVFTFPSNNWYFFYVHKVASMLTGTLDVLRGICKVNTAKEEVKAEMEDYIR